MLVLRESCAGICARKIETRSNAAASFISSRSKRPDAFDGLAHHPTLIFRIEEFHLVADYGEGALIRRAGSVFDDRPIGGPHEALGPERLVQAPGVLLRVEPGVGLLRKRPGVRDLDEDL